MKKLLFLCLFLTGCYSPLYMNDPYQPTNPDNISMRGRFERDKWWNNSLADFNEDIGKVCPNSEQIAYIQDWNLRPLWFFDEQDVVDKARYQTASLGGDGVSIYELKNYWWILFTFTKARSIAYKCNVSNKARYNSKMQSQSKIQPHLQSAQPQLSKKQAQKGYGYQQQYNQQRGYNY